MLGKTLRDLDPARELLLILRELRNLAPEVEAYIVEEIKAELQAATAASGVDDRN